MGNYFLRKGTSKEATLFVRIRKRVPKIDKNVNTRIVIDRNVWERANKDAASLEKFYRTKDGQTIYRKMCAIDQALEELLCQGKFNDENIDHAIVGCYTCQRYSDYSALTANNFTTTARGNKVVRLIQKKTSTPVVVPIMNDNLLRIAERYDFNIPEISDVILNRYIKDILKRLSEEIPSLQKTEITKLTMREREMEERGDAEFMRNEDGDVVKYRYDLVTSHTARRSGITNLYLTGLFDTVQMMSISGHKDQRTFFDYIKLSSDEIADKVMEKLRQSENVGNEGLF